MAIQELLRSWSRHRKKPASKLFQPMFQLRFARLKGLVAEVICLIADSH
ncbi:MAG: hypothetical protein JWL65_6313 [Gammaproteobacteria bacterium]|nr:hypothetical protein [Gammaproteobacteria bacterium]